MRANPHAITVALDLYFKGVSLRKIVDHLKQFERVNVSYAAVLYWIQKYVALMRGYVDTLRPELSRVFHADETKVMRALKRTDSAFIDGQRVYYDYLRPHAALEGRTPAEAAGIDLQLEGNKWEAIIKKASSTKLPNRTEESP